MSFSLTVLMQVIVMFILMLVGVLCYKKRLVDDAGSNQLTSLLLMIVNPVVVLNSFMTPFEERLAKNLLIAFALAVASHLIAMAVAYLFIRSHNNKGRAPIERFSIIYSNCGFMAIPLISALFGSEGVFYASAYITVFNLLSWTHGYISMSKKADKSSIIKAFTSPVVISVAVGILIFFLKIPMPSVIKDSASLLAGLNTPLAMLVLGISLAQMNILSALKTIRCYYVIILMNLVVPLCAVAIYLFLPIDKNLVLVNLVAVACPCAVTTLLFSKRLGLDHEYATRLLTLANISSIITIPSVIFIYQYFSSLFSA